MNLGYLPVIAAAAFVTYATRIAGLSLGKRQVPSLVSGFLSYVPIAVFAALIAPDLAHGGDETAPRLLGAAVAAIVVYRFNRLWACIAVGLATYWLARLSGL